MTSIFISDNNDQPPQRPSEPSRPKRPRSSLACLRCRKKKVKCDFVQPTCGRCASQNLICNYAQPPRRVDGRAFELLGNHVEQLKERMRRMQTELAMLRENNFYPINMPTSMLNTSNALMNDGSNFDDNPTMLFDSFNSSNNNSNSTGLMDRSTLTNQQAVTWKASLLPSGLRIDTNIANVIDLYRIILHLINQFSITCDSVTSFFNIDSIKVNNITKRKQLKMANGDGDNKSNTSKNETINDNNSSNNGTLNRSDRLWEVDEREARQILREQKQQDIADMSPRLLDQLMHTHYHKCFLAYQIVDKKTFMEQYMNQPGLDPLLANSISAWVAKHGCVYHDMSTNGQQLCKMGDTYFKNARQILKKSLDVSSPNTIQAILNLYMFQLSSEQNGQPYLYIGLAKRMARDLKFNKKEHLPSDPVERETCKRLWWSTYWLDLCASIESNRITTLDDKDCDIDYPSKLDSEDEETGYRIEFCVHSIKLMKICKEITKHLPSEQSGQSLLSTISQLENDLTNWLSELPKHLKFTEEDTFSKTGSFCDEAMLILSIQYHTTWIMLHRFFLPKNDQSPTTPIALLSLNICMKSANFITKMIDIYSTNLHWCQFFYTLNGIIASVSIHQINAVSNENDLSYIAQRNLIKTAAILSGSPLTYMKKVNDIIESIGSFLKENNLSTNIDDIPSINEETVNSQQSISTFYQPGSFDQSNTDQLRISSSPPSLSSSSPPLHSVSTTTVTGTNTTPITNVNVMTTASISTPVMVAQYQQHQQQNPSPSQNITTTPNLVQSTISMTIGPSSSSSVTSVNTTTPAFSMSSPRPISQQHSRIQSQATVPSQLSPQRYPNNNTAMVSPIPMTQTSHVKEEMVSSLPKQQLLPSQPQQRLSSNMYDQLPPHSQQLQQQLQQQHHHHHQQQQQQQHSMADSSMMFNNTIIGMDPALFQMGTHFGQQTSFTNPPFHHPSMLSSSQSPPPQQQPPPPQHQTHPDMATVFTSNTMLTNVPGYGSNQPQPHPHQPSHPHQHPGYNQVNQMYPPYSTTYQPHSQSQVAVSTGLYNASSIPTTSANAPMSSMHNNNHHHNNTGNNNSTNHNHNNNNPNNSSSSNNGLMPNEPNNLLSLNQEAMNSFLQFQSYQNSPFGFPPNQEQSMINPDLMCLPAANRKRQRNWDQQNS
ncbi:unnamed protein product [Cunninghamella blakesleeana]